MKPKLIIFLMVLSVSFSSYLPHITLQAEAAAVALSDANSVSRETAEAPSTQFTWSIESSKDYVLPKQIRYTFSLQNLENKPARDIKLWIYAPCIKTSHQLLKALKISTPARLEQDQEGNIICAFSFPEILPYETKIFHFRADLMMSESPQPVAMENIQPYLKPERLIESDHPKILEKASKLKKKEPYQTARALYNWVSDHIKGAGFLDEDKGALYAMSNLEGDCTEYATLFVALCRACDIPARMLCGYICERNCLVKTVDFHHWAEFYHNGAWHLVDPQNKVFDQGGDRYMATEIYRECLQNPLGEYHRYRFQGEGVRLKMKMTD